MTFRHLFVVPAMLCVTGAFAQTAPKTAHAEFVNGMGEKIGTAIITQTAMGVRMELMLTKLPPGLHGVHIHTVGKCDGPAFTTAGGHLNPDMKMHGKDNPMGPHAGDLMNIEADMNGNAKATLLGERVGMGEGAASLFHEGGTALVIHAQVDDYKTDPTGNSGGRIACGVIEK